MISTRTRVRSTASFKPPTTRGLLGTRVTELARAEPTRRTHRLRNSATSSAAATGRSRPASPPISTSATTARGWSTGRRVYSSRPRGRRDVAGQRRCKLREDYNAPARRRQAVARTGTANAEPVGLAVECVCRGVVVSPPPAGTGPEHAVDEDAQWATWRASYERAPASHIEMLV